MKNLYGTEQVEELKKQLKSQTRKYEYLLELLTPLLDELIKLKNSEGYYSCEYLQNGCMNFVGNNLNGFVTCCDSINADCFLPCCSTAADTLNLFKKQRTVINAEIKIYNLLDVKYHNSKNRLFTSISNCYKCKHFKLRNWEFNSALQTVCFGGDFINPCQSKCIYCDNSHNIDADKMKKNKITDKYYNKIFDIVYEAKKRGILSEKINYIVAPGEITIHPYKDKIYECIKGQRCIIRTNCFEYDEKIAAFLAENPKTAINLSIDCGTDETWYKVKGVNNFQTVIKNLTTYSKSCINSEQIQLKYIVLPGINDNLNDYQSLKVIMNNLKIKKLIISENFKSDDFSKNINEKKYKEIINISSFFVKNGFELEFLQGVFTDDECNKIMEGVKK